MTPSTKTATKRAILYARISKDRNGEQAGVTRQLEACRDLVAQRGWTLVGEHTDNDISAYSGKRRPEYLAMLEAVRAGEADAIVVWHPDRLTRNPRELEDLLDVIESRRIAVVTVQAGDVDLSTTSGRAVARTLVAWARHESEHKANRQRAAIEDAAKRGVRHGFVPFGWRNSVPTRVPFTTTETEADIVAEIVARLLGGDTLRTLARDLNRRQVATLRGGNWTEQQIRQVALRPSNAGQRSHHGSVVAENCWPALVSADDHERLVRLLSDPKRKSARHGRKHVLSGIARCGKCGGALRFATLNGRRVFRCENLDLSITAEPLTEFVLELVHRRLNADDADAISEPGSIEYDELTGHLAVLRGRLDDLAVHLADGVLDRDQVRVAGDRLRDEVTRTEADLLEIEKKSAALRSRGVDVYGLTVERQRALLKGLLDLKVMPATRTGAAARQFDYDRISVSWK